MAIQKRIRITIDNGSSWFMCPNPDCRRKIRYQNAYPLGFMWKVCGGCRLQWVPAPGSEHGPHRSDLEVGTTLYLDVFSSGRRV